MPDIDLDTLQRSKLQTSGQGRALDPARLAMIAEDEEEILLGVHASQLIDIALRNLHSRKEALSENLAIFEFILREKELNNITSKKKSELARELHKTLNSLHPGTETRDLKSCEDMVESLLRHDRSQLKKIYNDYLKDNDFWRKYLADFQNPEINSRLISGDIVVDHETFSTLTSILVGIHGAVAYVNPGKFNTGMATSEEERFLITTLTRGAVVKKNKKGELYTTAKELGHFIDRVIRAYDQIGTNVTFLGYREGTLNPVFLDFGSLEVFHLNDWVPQKGDELILNNNLLNPDREVFSCSSEPFSGKLALSTSNDPQSKTIIAYTRMPKVGHAFEHPYANHDHTALWSNFPTTDIEAILHNAKHHYSGKNWETLNESELKYIEKLALFIDIWQPADRIVSSGKEAKHLVDRKARGFDLIGSILDLLEVKDTINREGYFLKQGNSESKPKDNTEKAKKLKKPETKVTQSASSILTRSPIARLAKHVAVGATMALGGWICRHPIQASVLALTAGFGVAEHTGAVPESIRSIYTESTEWKGDVPPPGSKITYPAPFDTVEKKWDYPALVKSLGLELPKDKTKPAFQVKITMPDLPDGREGKIYYKPITPQNIFKFGFLPGRPTQLNIDNTPGFQSLTWEASNNLSEFIIPEKQAARGR